jgi:hypothetical protein
MSIRKIKKHHIATIMHILAERKAVQKRVDMYNNLPESYYKKIEDEVMSTPEKPALTVTQKLEAELTSGNITLNPFHHQGSRIAREMFASQVQFMKNLAPVDDIALITTGHGNKDKLVHELADHYVDHLDNTQFADNPGSIRAQLLKSRHLDSTPPQHPQGIYEYNHGKMVDGSLIIENRPSHKIDPLLIEPLKKAD